MKARILTLTFAVLLLVWSSAPARQENQQKRERAIDRIVHIENGIIREIPQVPRLCDRMEIEKGKIAIGGCNFHVEQEGEGVLLFNGTAMLIGLRSSCRHL